MGEVLLNLLPLFAGATLAPIYPAIALLLLQGEGGLSKAIALMVGGVTVRLLQGVLFGILFDIGTHHYEEDEANVLVSTLLLILAILLLLKAYKTWRKEDDPEESLPKWMSAFTQVSILKAAGIGALYVLVSPKQWVFTLSAIGSIGEGHISYFAAIALYLLFVLGTQVLVLTPILMLTFSPQSAGQKIDAANGWLAKHNDTVIIVVSLVFGLWFAIKAINGFLV